MVGLAEEAKLPHSGGREGLDVAFPKPTRLGREGSLVSMARRNYKGVIIAMQKRPLPAFDDSPELGLKLRFAAADSAKSLAAMPMAHKLYYGPESR